MTAQEEEIACNNHDLLIQGFLSPNPTMLLSSSQSASTVGGFVMSARAVLGHPLYFLTDTRMRAADLSEGARRSMYQKH